jgi:valyl-tRNA synthetase
LHGLVLDKFGKKMSKSKGNGIDPMDTIEKFGADATRLSLLIGSTPGNDVRISEEKIKSFRNFVTKLWNIYRFIATTFPEVKLEEKISKKNIKTLSDRWIISKLNILIAEVTSDLDKYKFSLAGEKLQNFIWNDLADWYLEISKIEKNKYVINYVINSVLRLVHPFAPFISEKIYSDITGNKNKKMLMIEKWPISEKKLIDKKAQKEFQDLQETITKIRNIRASYHIDPAKMISARAEKISNQEIIEKFGRIKFGAKIEKGIGVSGRNINIVLDIAKIIDVKKEKEKLQKEIKNLENLISKTNALLKNKKFLASAPKEIVDKNKGNIVEYEIKLKIQEELFKSLNNLM